MNEESRYSAVDSLELLVGEEFILSLGLLTGTVFKHWLQDIINFLDFLFRAWALVRNLMD